MRRDRRGFEFGNSQLDPLDLPVISNFATCSTLHLRSTFIKVVCLFNKCDAPGILIFSMFSLATRKLSVDRSFQLPAEAHTQHNLCNLPSNRREFINVVPAGSPLDRGDSQECRVKFHMWDELID